jgi:transcriptional regulator with XRE-family HTH domain
VLLNALMPQKTKRREPTAEELAESARLRSIYMAKRDELGLNQTSLGELMGFSTQSAVSQYMHGLPMSMDVILKFAHHLKVDPAEIRPDFWDSIPLRDPSGDISADSLAWAQMLEQLPPEEAEMAKGLIRLLHEKRQKS